jgi:ubiquinone/menaquinone biosynthesis C-methylase UbiE
VSGDIPVDPALYTEEYFLGCCSGADTFDESLGLAISPVAVELLERLGAGPGTRAVDVGSGRGELVLNLAKRGATAVGLDYADAALQLAQQMLGQHDELAERVVFVKSDAKQVPLRTGTFDLAFMLDIVEHLHPWELHAALVEVRRLLRPSGVLCIHTMPNRNYYRWVYPPLRVAGRLVGRSDAPRDPRIPYEHQMHVNEQTPRSLQRALHRAGYQVQLWVDGFEKSPLDPGFLDRLVRVIAKRRPFRRVASFHIFALARPR